MADQQNKSFDTERNKSATNLDTASQEMQERRLFEELKEVDRRGSRKKVS